LGTRGEAPGLGLITDAQLVSDRIRERRRMVFLTVLRAKGKVRLACGFAVFRRVSYDQDGPVMLLRTATRHSSRLVIAICLFTLLLAGCNPEHYPQTTLLPRGDFARIADDLLDTTVKWAVLVFILVEGVLIYAIFRFRGKPDDPEPQQTHGNTTVEIIWTVIPALILAAIAVPTVRAIFQTNATPKRDALNIEVVGHQWWWEFRYPEYNLTTANEIHVPVGRTVSLRMGSADVIHSFWAPQFAGKRDVFANRQTRLWFKAEALGEYPGQCAEFCGIQHARMGYRIKSQKPEEFQAWVAHMQSLSLKPPPEPPKPAAGTRSDKAVHTASVGATVQAAAQGPDYAAGEKLFQSKGCVACHALYAVNAPKGMIGPNLANVGARSYIAAGTLKNTDENLARWIRNPQAIKKGVLMPNLGLSENEAKTLAGFLRAHQ
jgi:cytochrome c oxidase subunit II